MVCHLCSILAQTQTPIPIRSPPLTAVCTGSTGERKTGAQLGRNQVSKCRMWDLTTDEVISTSGGVEAERADRETTVDEQTERLGQEQTPCSPN